MALDFPANPAAQTPVNTFSPTSTPEANTSNDLIYVWDGEKWGVEPPPKPTPPPTRDSMEAPVVGGVTLTDTNVGGRFTSEVFQVDATITNEGDPASNKHARVKFTNADGVIETSPETDDIDTVGSASGTDGVTIGYTNDNSWNDITYAGPPWNAYIAYAPSGSSPEKIAMSSDGVNWELYSPSGLSTDYNNIIYLPTQQKLAATGYRQISLCDGLDFAFDETYQVGNLNNDTRGWQYCIYYPPDDSVWTIWTHWGNPSWAKAYAADIPNGTSAWTIRGGPSNYLSHIKLSNDVLTCVAGGNHPSSPQGGYIANPSDSGWSNSNYDTEYFNYSGACHMGVRDTWVFAFNNTIYEGGSGRSIPQTGWSVNADLNTALDASITNVVINDFVYCEEIGVFTGVGQCTYNGDVTRGLVITTTDGTNWNWIVTNPEKQYNWSRVMWNSDRQEMVMVASSGTDPGGRLGSSSTLGTTQSFTQLAFVSATGLTSFKSGMAVTESGGGDGTGVIVSIDNPNETMLLKAVTGTWDPGDKVQGPATNYSTGYAQLAADGSVTGVQPEQGYTQMNTTDFDVQFPATFADGSVPDTQLPANTTIEVEYRARSEINGFIADSDVTSNQITPT